MSMSDMPLLAVRNKAIATWLILVGLNLDSHANMPVVGCDALVIEDTGKTVPVKPFTSDCEELPDAPIVDAIVKWEDEMSGKAHLLLMKHALHAPSNRHNSDTAIHHAERLVSL